MFDKQLVHDDSNLIQRVTLNHKYINLDHFFDENDYQDVKNLRDTIISQVTKEPEQL